MTFRTWFEQPSPSAFAALGAFLLAGCAVRPDFVKPESELREALLAPRHEHAAVQSTSDAAVPEHGCRLFNDAVLTDLQERAFNWMPRRMTAKRCE